jgi:hypothetical protein
LAGGARFRFTNSPSAGRSAEKGEDLSNGQVKSPSIGQVEWEMEIFINDT